MIVIQSLFLTDQKIRMDLTKMVTLSFVMYVIGAVMIYMKHA
jgi:hypothetical protein